MKNKPRLMVWRDGRPRWEPSPTARTFGFKGVDLKDENGRWLSYEDAVARADEINAQLDAHRISLGHLPIYRRTTEERAEERAKSKQRRNWQPKIEEAAEVSLHRSGYVYFLWAADMVKIGYSANPFVRLANLETSIPRPMDRVVIVTGTIADERRLHRRFQTQRSHGEWFRATQYLNDLLMEIAAVGTAKNV